MLLRVVRATLSALLLVLGLPLLLVGGLLYLAAQHQHPGGGYAAELSTVTTGGHAVVVSDVDALLRRDAPFARGGQTTLRLSARTGPAGAAAFVGLAPAAQAAAYLDGVAHTELTGVGLTRGPLPVAADPVAGARPPAAPPAQQPFWVAGSTSGALEWRPHEHRGEQLALVVMAADGSAPLSVDMTARVLPGWLSSTAYGLLVLGGLLTVLGIAAVVWQARPRQVVYVVPPGQLPEVAARLGVPVPGELGRPELAGAAPAWQPDGPVGVERADAGPGRDEPVAPEPAAGDPRQVEPRQVEPAGATEPGSAGAGGPATGGDPPPAQWPAPSLPHVTATPVAVAAGRDAEPEPSAQPLAQRLRLEGVVLPGTPVTDGAAAGWQEWVAHIERPPAEAAGGRRHRGNGATGGDVRLVSDRLAQFVPHQ